MQTIFTHWLPYSIIATLFLGISMSLYKMPSFKGYSSFFSTFWTNVFSTLFVVIFLVITSPDKLLFSLAHISWYAIVWGVLFALTMVFQKILLKQAETNSVFPITSAIGNVVTIVIGVVLLSESLSIVQAFGIVIILISTYLFTKKEGSFPVNNNTIFLALGIISTSTLSKYIQKIGAVHNSPAEFMTWQYVGASLCALAVAYFFEKENFANIVDMKKYWKGSLLISVFSVIGGWAILKALSVGPLSGVYAIHPAYTFVAAIVGVLLFNEKLTVRKIVLALVSVIGVILLKIG